MAANEHLWPIAELARRVAVALAHDYVGPADSRAKDVPDVRAIRWYSTIGLLDKPVSFRGRTALYGTRHLYQIVAVKRRQAQGKPLAEIQKELAGASDATLAAIAAVDDHVGVDEAPVRREPFWKQKPVSPTGNGLAARQSEPMASSPVPELSYGVPIAPGVTVLITSSHAPSPADAAALREAAQPLLQTIATRGLISPKGEQS